MNHDIVNDFREYARNTGRWFKRYLDNVSPKTDIPRTELTDAEFKAMARAAKKGTLKVKVHA